MQKLTNKHELRHALIRHPEFGFGNIVLHINCQRNAIAFYVTRNNPPQLMRAFEEPDQARKAFRDVLNGFLAYHWKIVNYGRPNFG